MNSIKQEWIENLKKIMEQIDPNYQIKFISNRETNRFYYNQNDKKHFIMSDIIFEVAGKLVSIQMMSDETKEYRFSDDLKYFWEYDRKTNKRTRWQTNWPEIWRMTKKAVDNFNEQYNIFIMIAYHVKREGSKNGIYAVENHYINDFLKKFNWD